MAGEFILKIMDEENLCLACGHRKLVYDGPVGSNPGLFIVWERRPHQKKAKNLIETHDEKLACKILKGE